MKHLLILSFCFTQAATFYLPSLAPKTYCTAPKEDGPLCYSEIPLFVNRLDSPHSVLPFDYKRFPFCQAPDGAPLPPGENIGQVLFGERIAASPIEFKFNERKNCTPICDKKITIPTKGMKPEQKKASKPTVLLVRAIQMSYSHYWIVDNLPVMFCYEVAQEYAKGGSTKIQHCDRGFPIGCTTEADGSQREFCQLDGKFVYKGAAPKSQEKGQAAAWTAPTYYLFNHFKFEITYHPRSGSDWGETIPQEVGDAGRITKVTVKLESRQNCTDDQPEYLNHDLNKESAIQTIKYSYEVRFIKSSTIKWSSRWDYILHTDAKGKIQWFQILNSLIIVLFLTGILAIILVRTLHRDTARYKQENVEEAQEEFGWKSIHGDVFRPPRFGMLLSVLIGNGVQIFLMALITLLFACLGFLSPANRGFLMTCAVVSYILMGTPSGYASSRIYKMFGGENWKSNVLLTAFLVPGIIFGMFFILNLVLWGEQSSAAIPFSTLVAILCLWFFLSAPLTFIGAYFGFKKTSIENPVQTNQIPRQIPPQSCCTQPLPRVLIGAILPFGCIFLQLYFILNSIWRHQVYDSFGFLFFVFIIFVITSSEIAILLCYFHLCAEDYNWWWRLFMTTGFTAFYLFLYCIYFFTSKMDLTDKASTFLFFGYSTMMVFVSSCYQVVWDSSHVSGSFEKYTAL